MTITETLKTAFESNARSAYQVGFTYACSQIMRFLVVYRRETGGEASTWTVGAFVCHLAQTYDGREVVASDEKLDLAICRWIREN